MTYSDPNARDQDLINTVAEAFLAGLQSGSEPDIEFLLAENEELREPLEERLWTVLAVWRATQANAGADKHDSPPADPDATVDSGDLPSKRPVGPDRSRKVHCPHCGIGLNLVTPEELSLIHI